MSWKAIKPNKQGDWINQRNESFDEFISIGNKKNNPLHCFFNPYYSNGVKTNRDAWVYNFNIEALANNMKTTINLYNISLQNFRKKSKGITKPKADDFIDFSQRMITWTREIKWDLEKGKEYTFDSNSLTLGLYRPFIKQNIYFNKGWNNMQYQIPKLFPSPNYQNLVICLPAPGGKKDFSVLISKIIPDIHLNGDNQCFPLYYYEERQKQNPNLFDEAGESEYIRRDGVSDFILERAIKAYGKRVTKEDIFYYVYGILHSPEYIETFKNDLKKMLPRIPLVDEPRDFWKFSKAGRSLAEIHINYEDVAPYPDLKITGNDSGAYTVEKMRFPKKGQKDTIIYNSKVLIENIPDKAYEYVVNGKSALEWIMERYQVKVDKKSGIKNDPNDWSKEVGNPRYILDLVLSIVNVSVQTVDIVNELPKLKFD